MRFTSNHSQMDRIIDSLSNNRITDFHVEGMSPNVKSKHFKSSTLMNSSKQLLGNSASISPRRNLGSLSKSNTTNLKNSYAGYTSQSQPSFKAAGNEKETNQLRMSLPSKSIASLVKGKDVRPDLHTKTYFKATTSIYIQNSPYLPTSLDKLNSKHNSKISKRSPRFSWIGYNG